MTQYKYSIEIDGKKAGTDEEDVVVNYLLGRPLQEHIHEWEWYDGCLGYESRVCKTCKVDWNDLPKEEQ